MPLVEVTEPHAREPRIGRVRPAGPLDEPIQPDRGWAELEDIELTATVLVGPEATELIDCDRLSIAGSRFDGVGIGSGPSSEIRNSWLEGCDLSGARVTTLRGSTLVGCKLQGTDLSDATLVDVVFERCRLRYTNLRMARLERVAFVDCVLDDVDAFDLRATDVSFDGSVLRTVNVDRLQATRVDLRGVSELGLAAVGRLDGCLVADHQLAALAPALAMAVGLDLERPDDEGADR